MKQSLVMTKSPPWMNKNIEVFIKGKNVLYNSLLQKKLNISVFKKVKALQAKLRNLVEFS